MIVRISWFLTGLLVAGVVGAFLLYVSPLSLATAIAVVMGLVATLILGYLAGLSTLDGGSEEDRSHVPGDGVRVTDVPGDVAFFAEMAATNAQLRGPNTSSPKVSSSQVGGF
jgi:hypothetical protein